MQINKIVVLLLSVLISTALFGCGEKKDTTQTGTTSGDNKTKVDTVKQDKTQTQTQTPEEHIFSMEELQ